MSKANWLSHLLRLLPLGVMKGMSLWHFKNKRFYINVQKDFHEKEILSDCAQLLIILNHHAETCITSVEDYEFCP